MHWDARLSWTRFTCKLYTVDMARCYCWVISHWRSIIYSLAKLHNLGVTSVANEFSSSIFLFSQFSLTSLAIQSLQLQIPNLDLLAGCLTFSGARLLPAYSPCAQRFKRLIFKMSDFGVRNGLLIEKALAPENWGLRGSSNPSSEIPKFMLLLCQERENSRDKRCLRPQTSGSKQGPREEQEISKSPCFHSDAPC